MPCKWIGCIHKGQVGKSWSWSEKTHRYDPENKLCNDGRPEYDMRLHAEVSTEPTKEEWLSSVWRVRLPRLTTGAR